jgi:hypothetical protein
MFVFGPGNLSGFDRPQDRGSVQADCSCGCCEGVGHGVAYLGGERCALRCAVMVDDPLKVSIFQ